LQENPVAGRDFLKGIGSNRILRERKVSVKAEMPWKILANLPAEPRRGEAAIFEHTIWLRTLNEIRTFFKQNPEDFAD
jgi:hypothetical protein